MNNWEAQYRYNELEIERNELIFYVDEIKDSEDIPENQHIEQIEIDISRIDECMNLLKKIIELNDEIAKLKAYNQELEKGLVYIKGQR